MAVTIKHSGRYANWLWQVAMAYITAKRYKIEYFLHRDKYDTQHQMLPILPMDEWIAKTKHYKTYIDPRPHKFAWPNPIGLDKWEISDSGNFILEGWFQSFKYLQGYEKELLNLFSVPIKPIEKVSIHVRRGDYLQWQASFPVLPLQYYMKAIAAFKNNGINEFIVFSDDIPWCRENFSFDGCKFEFSENDVFEDFRQMCNCRGSIIANSSLSQLAAILNPNPDKVVFCPHADSWYGAKNNCYTGDMCPPEFISIKI